MTGAELRAARRTLGERWGLGRPLHMSEMGRALQLEGRDPGATVRDWETRNRVSGPVAVSLAFMLGGDPITSRLSEIVDPRTSVAKND